MALLVNQITVGDIIVATCDVSPITSGGLDLPQGSTASALNGDGIFYKFGPGITDWRSAGSGNYVHTQSIPATTWVVTHNLGKRASIQVIDATGVDITAEITWDNDNQVTVRTNTPETGFVYCN